MGSNKLTSDVYQKNFLSSLQDFKRKQIALDMTLISMDHAEIPVHAVVMATASGFIHSKLQDQLSNNLVYTFESITTQCLELLVDFAYSGELNFTALDPNSIWPLLSACSQLQMTDALQLCHRYLEKNKKSNIKLEKNTRDSESDLSRSAVDTSVKTDVSYTYNDDSDAEELSLPSIQAMQPQALVQKTTRDKCFASKKKRIIKGKAASNVTPSRVVTRKPTQIKRRTLKCKVICRFSKGERTCNLCNKTFQHRSVLLYHKRMQHLHGNYRRRLVGLLRYLPFAALLALDQQHALANKQFQCKWCGMKLKFWSKLKWHIEQKHLCKYKCGKCDGKFQNVIQRELHFRRKHRYHTLGKSGRKTVQCSLCNKRFLYKNNLVRHISACHITNNEQSTRNTGAKVTQSKKRMGSVGGQVSICSLCKKSFTRRCNLRDHLATKHNIGGIRCQQCDRGFASNRDYTDHMDAVHYNKRKHECNVCQRTFVRKSSYDRHMKEQCGNPLYHLKPKKPTPEKHFQCSLCLHFYSTAQNLSEHIKTIHKCQIYPCKVPDCQASFRFRSSRKKHMDTKHKGYILHI